jgi:mannose-6-phosphate isomerase-like protein (cupin superfamily)
MAERFDKFTERARKVLQLSQEEAQRFNHNYIGTEHLLLGLVREGEGVAYKVLVNLGVDPNNVRSAVEFIVGRGENSVRGEIGLTPRAKKVIELAVAEARRLNHNYIGTEHILLGLLREGEGIAVGVLESLGVSIDRVRQQVNFEMTQSGPPGMHEAQSTTLRASLGGESSQRQETPTTFAVSNLDEVIAGFDDDEGTMDYRVCASGAGFEYGVVRFAPLPEGQGWYLVHWERDVIYEVLQGSGQIAIVRGETHDVSDGTVVQIPAGTAHEVRPPGGPLFVLQITVNV